MDGPSEIRRSIEDAGSAATTCPKRMSYGPCGGVRGSGACELDDRLCPFVDRPLVRWQGPLPTRPVAAFGDVARPGGPGPVIVTDLRVRPFDPASVTAVVDRLATTTDLLLVGEHHVRADFPPTVMASLVEQAGGRAWMTLTCRDRNRVLLESELEGLAVVGVAGVHCVTGDARARSVRDDASQVFDLDGTRLAALARAAGHTPSVAETPAAPPFGHRPARVVEKERAGAAACFVNHAGGAAAVARFVSDAHRAGATLPFVPCVAVFTDLDSLVVLERFPGLHVDPAVRRAVLEAPDMREAGIDAAVDEAERMLAIPGVVGVDLSGSATAGSELDTAAIMAEIATRLRDRIGDPAEPALLSPTPP